MHGEARAGFVLVRAAGNVALVRRVWRDFGTALAVTDDEGFNELQRGGNPERLTVAFALRDCYQPVSGLTDGTIPDWAACRPWRMAD